MEVMEEEVQLVDHGKPPKCGKNCCKAWSWMTCVRVTIISIIACVVLVFLVTPLIYALTGNDDSKFQQLLLNVFDFIQGIPNWLKALVMMEIYALFIPFGCPMTPLNLVAGFFFGPFLGTFVAVAGASVGSVVCYLWALTLVQEWAEEKLNSKRIFKAIELAVQNDAMKLIFLTHICPVFSTTILNYLFATMGVSFVKFIVATMVGFLPLTFMYCLIGSLSENLVTAFQGGSGEGVWKIVIILALSITSVILLVGILFYIGRRKIKSLMKQLEEQEKNDALHLGNGDEDDEAGYARNKTSSINNYDDVF